MPAGPTACLPCAPSHSWTVKKQCVDLLAEGLWEELLDDEQPDITVMDWYVSLTTRLHTGAPQSASLAPSPLWPELPTRTLLPLQDPALPIAPSLLTLWVLKCARPEAYSFLHRCLSFLGQIPPYLPYSLRVRLTRRHQEASPGQAPSWPWLFSLVTA